MSETVTRLRGVAQADPYSAETTDIDWSTPDELDIPTKGIEPGSSQEVLDATGQRLEVDLTVYLPFAADVKPQDRVRVRGLVYDVQGDRHDWRNPYTDAEPGSVVRLRRTPRGASI